MPEDKRVPRSRRFAGELPGSPRAHRPQPRRTPPPASSTSASTPKPRRSAPVEEPTRITPPVPPPLRERRPQQRKPAPPPRQRRQADPQPEPPRNPLPSKPLVDKPRADQPRVNGARPEQRRPKPAEEPTRLTPPVKPIVRKRPPKPSVAQTTVVQRQWRNEPTVLIPVVGDDEPPPPKPTEPAPSTRLQTKRKQKDHRSLMLAKVALGLVAVLVFLGAGGAWGMKVWYNSKFNQVAALDEDSKDIKHKAIQIGTENFLILGSDTRAGAPKGAGIGTERTIKGARSDTLMIAHLPKDRERAILVSFPRDLEITRPECNRWDYKTGQYSNEVIPETPQVKLNTAYAEGGPRCVIKWVQRLTGMQMNHFVGIDFAGFKGMVDAVGGVEVTVDTPIIDSVVGTVVEKPGRTKLTGERALSFVRARHVQGDPTSDYGRIKRQQQFIAALLGKTMSREVLFSPDKLGHFVSALADSATFDDNTGVDQLLELAQSMKGMSSKTVKFLTVPTTGYANELGNEVLIEEQAAAIFAALIHNRPVPGLDDDKPIGPGTQQDDTDTQAQDQSATPDSGSPG